MNSNSNLRTLSAALLLFFISCTPVSVSAPFSNTSMPAGTGTVARKNVPEFDHIAIIVFENWISETDLESPLMPVFNQYAKDYVLLTHYYGVKHPSLPNYIALISGETFDISDNCTGCFFDAVTLPDLIEKSGRTWKTYQEDMPETCYVDDLDYYVQKHNPFVYFDSIRLNKQRCDTHVVSMQALYEDISKGQLPNYMFITPNNCHNGHDCSLDVADKWLASQLDVLLPALGGEEGNYLLVLMFEEGPDNAGCCGLPEEDAGGHFPVVLVSPQAKNNFRDDTPYNHYSLLKTISASWELAYLGHAAHPETPTIINPWK